MREEELKKSRYMRVRIHVYVLDIMHVCESWDDVNSDWDTEHVRYTAAPLNLNVVSFCAKNGSKSCQCVVCLK